jgi:type I restriction enzyme S subunit
MSKTFPMVSMGEILTPTSRVETVEPDKTYRILGAHWYAEGLYIKDTKFGSAIQADRVYRIEQGDFVYNRLFAWKGAFAVATEKDHDCYVSNEFPTFSINRDRADAQYLRRYFSRASTWEEALQLSSGGTPTSRNRLKEDKLFAMKIPLPRKEEQQRIVARIEKIVTKVGEALKRHQQILADYDNLCRSFLFDKVNNDVVYTPMRELVRLREPDVFTQPEEQYYFAGVYCFGKGVFQGQHRSGTEFSYDRLTRLRIDNFVYPKLMAWEGALATVPAECDGLVVSPEFPVFEVNRERVLPETLDVYFRTPSVWPTLSGVSTGTNVRRRRLNPSDFLAFEFPLPSMRKQQQLQRVKQKIDILKRAQTKTSEKLNAMLPSILDKAFKGEL